MLTVSDDFMRVTLRIMIAHNIFVGNPVIHYEITKADYPMLLNGIATNVRMMVNSGVQLLTIGHETKPWLDLTKVGR
jgi:hypothetical protein